MSKHIIIFSDKNIPIRIKVYISYKPINNMLPSLEEIKKRRKVLGLTQTQLAKEAGVSQSLIAKLEVGKLEPTYTNAKKIFFVLDKLENKSSKKAKDIMSNKIIKIESKDQVRNAIKLMKKNNISQLPVFD